MLTTILLLIVISLLWYIANQLSVLDGKIVGSLNYDHLLRKIRNTEYPAFTYLQILEMQDALDKIVRDSQEVEQELFDSPGWQNVRGRDVTGDEERLMKEIIDANMHWDLVQMRMQFMIEANLAVRRGEWTIAQARQMLAELRGFGFGSVAEQDRLLKNWKQRVKGDMPVPDDDERSEIRATARKRQTELLAAWKEQYDPLAEQKPTYHNF